MMGHNLGGNGAHTYDLDTQRLIESWVEQGEAPANVVATHRSNGTADRTVRLCQYPAIAMYSGTGDPADANSFTCRVTR